MFKKNKANGKFDGLSEQQRTQARQFEAVAEKKRLESNKRLEDNMEGFQDSYVKFIVKKYGIRHDTRLVFADDVPSWIKKMVMAIVKPSLVLLECQEELDALAEKQESKAVIPNS